MYVPNLVPTALLTQKKKNIKKIFLEYSHQMIYETPTNLSSISIICN